MTKVMRRALSTTRAALFSTSRRKRLRLGQATSPRSSSAAVLTGKPALVGPGLLLAAATRRGGRNHHAADHLLSASTVCFLFLLRPDFVREQIVPLTAWALLGIATLAYGWVRHRRLGNLHLYSAKLAGTVGYVFVATLFFCESYSRTFFAVALGLAFLATAETLLVLLTRSRVDEHAGSILSPRRG